MKQEPFGSEPVAHTPSMLTFIVMLANGLRLLFLLVFFGMVAGVVSGLTAPAVYSSTVAFMPSGAESGVGGLSGLAGQFGVRLPSTGGGVSLSADALVEVMRSKAFLEAMAGDSVLRVEGKQQVRISIASAVGEEEGPPPLRFARAARSLRERLLVQQDKRTQIVRVSVATRWPEVSEAILNALLWRLDAHVKGLRASVDSSALAFAIRQSEVALGQLRAAERALAVFDDSNRGAQLSPYLRVQRERLQRQVSLAQDLYGSLEQTRVETSLRTLRNAQALLVLENPTYAAIRDARGTVGKALLGGVIGLMAGVVLLLVRGQFAHAIQVQDPDAIALASIGRRLWPSRRR